MNQRNDTSLWVFGYGSICWHPGFTYGQSIVGSITGFSRRFWQGNTTHRGVPGKPGRVATLIEEPKMLTYGVAFQLLGEAALDYLNQREVQLGGYVSHITLFQPKDSALPPFPVLLYVATPSNQHWLGPQSLDKVAEQVVHSSGNSGHNVEYVLRLADWMRDKLPDIEDDHLYTIETHIYRIINEKNLCLKSMMQDENCKTHSIPNSSGHNKDKDERELETEDISSDSESTPSTSKYSSNVLSKKLRCVKLN